MTLLCNNALRRYVSTLLEKIMITTELYVSLSKIYEKNCQVNLSMNYFLGSTYLTSIFLSLTGQFDRKELELERVEFSLGEHF